jgi:hypothetical protein
MTTEKKKIDEIITEYLKKPKDSSSHDEFLQELKNLSPVEPSLYVTKSIKSAELDKSKAEGLLNDMALSNKKLRALSSTSK